MVAVLGEGEGREGEVVARCKGYAKICPGQVEVCEWYLFMAMAPRPEG